MSGSKWLKKKAAHQIRASQVCTSQGGIEEVSASHECTAQRCALQVGAQVFLIARPVEMRDKGGFDLLANDVEADQQFLGDDEDLGELAESAGSSCGCPSRAARRGETL